MMSITTAIFALKIRCFLIAQQIEMAIVNTKAVDIFAVIVPRNLNAQKAKIACEAGNTACMERYIEKAEDIRHTLGNKEIYQKRKETIERIFGTAKEHHGFRCTQYIGKARMKMKAGLTLHA